jgi:hypothetical protein
MEAAGPSGEFFPDTARTDHTIFCGEDCIVSEWTLIATQTEPFFGGQMRAVPIRVRGILVVRIKNGKIMQWSDYCDQPTSRRHALAGCFTEWIEL